MLIYAKFDINAGEELNISYIGFDPCCETRQLSLNVYGFECDCARCMLDKRQADHFYKKERNEILKKVLVDIFKFGKNIKVMEIFLIFWKALYFVTGAR